jgi:hypothetical protein
VPLFESLPPLAGRQLPFAGLRPLSQLPRDLVRTFRGRTLTVQDVFDMHNVGTPFIKRNYKKVLIQMEEDGLVSCEPDAASRRRNTMADHVLVTFPKTQTQ